MFTILSIIHVSKYIDSIVQPSSLSISGTFSSSQISLNINSIQCQPLLFYSHYYQLQ